MLAERCSILPSRLIMKLKGKVLEMWRGHRRKRDKNVHYILYIWYIYYILYCIHYATLYTSVTE